MARLRIGSVFTTQKGHTFKVVRAVVRSSGNGAESPCVLVERTIDGRIREVLLTTGILAHQTRGSLHNPGHGAVIDWAAAERLPQSRRGLVGVYQPSLRRRSGQA